MRVFLLIVITGFCTAPLSAQTVSGRLMDERSGAPLAGALVIIQEKGETAVDTAKTSSDGSWSLVLTGVAGMQTGRQPAHVLLFPNYPNPFNPSTSIAFALPVDGTVRVEVHNTLGQKVDEASASLSVGIHHIDWQAKGAAGLYFYSICFDGLILRGKMIQLDAGSGRGLGAFSAGAIGMDASRSASDWRENEIRLAKSSGGRDYRLIFTLFGYCPDTLGISLAGGEYLERQMGTIHSRALVIDLHNDILERMIEDPGYHLVTRHSYWQTDLPRLRDGGIDLQLFAVWVEPGLYSAAPFAAALRMLERLESEMALANGELRQVRSASEIGASPSAASVDFMIGVEGGHVIENDLNKLYELYHRGVRMLTITWNNSTDWAVSCDDANSSRIGLSDFGRQVIKACDSLGIVIDLSHVGAKTIQDILATSHNPVIASHSGAYALRAHKRNLTDAQIRAIAESGGVIGVIFYPPFIAPSGQSATIQTVIAHIDHIVKLAGIDHAALGSDFDGVGDFLPAGLKDTAAMPGLTLALLQHGYTQEAVEKILGRNILRVFNRVCP